MSSYWSKRRKLKRTIEEHLDKIRADNVVDLSNVAKNTFLETEINANVADSGAARGGTRGTCPPPETFPMLMLKCLIYACARVFEDIFELTMILQIKSYLRTTMCPTRLNGFGQITINRDLNINEKTVIDIFLRKKRRLSFIF